MSGFFYFEKAMINLNGELQKKSEPILNYNNRGFKYGDALFETIKVVNLECRFLEDHYFRVMASMRMIRMEIPMYFTMEFFENEIIKTVKYNKLENARVRFTIYRDNGGLYLPLNNKINFLIEVEPLNVQIKSSYVVDLFKDFYVYSGLLSTLKTTNKFTNVLAGIYANENNYDNCILLNERKHVVEVINGNIFLVFGKIVKTPPIEDGCVKGIIRKKIISHLEEQSNYTIEETSISPFDLQKADEIFISNSIIDIQPVTNYRKSSYKIQLAAALQEWLKNLI